MTQGKNTALVVAANVALIQEDGKVFITSQEVAEKFRKRHDDVLRKIRGLDCGDEYLLRNFAEISVVDSYGRSQPSYRMNRDGFIYLASRFTGPEAAAWMIKIIEVFNLMEATIRRQLDEARAIKEASRNIEQACIEALTNSILKVNYEHAETRQKVVEIEQLVDVHGERIEKLTADVIDMKSKRYVRREVTDKTKALHRMVFLALGSRCPCCNKPAEATECDHWFSVQKADFAHTWPICVECHSALTNGRKDRLETKSRFEAYQEFAAEVLPQQKGLF